MHQGYKPGDHSTQNQSFPHYMHSQSSSPPMYNMGYQPMPGYAPPQFMPSGYPGSQNVN
jgi:hypothetical protein